MSSQGFWFQFFLAFWRACFWAYGEYQIARRQAIKEVPDAETDEVRARFLAALERMQREQGSPPQPEIPSRPG